MVSIGGKPRTSKQFCLIWQLRTFTDSLRGHAPRSASALIAVSDHVHVDVTSQSQEVLDN
jgi:hypothetical protein